MLPNDPVRLEDLFPRVMFYRSFVAQTLLTIH